MDLYSVAMVALGLVTLLNTWRVTRYRSYYWNELHINSILRRENCRLYDEAEELRNEVSRLRLHPVNQKVK